MYCVIISTNRGCKKYVVTGGIIYIQFCLTCLINRLCNPCKNIYILTGCNYQRLCIGGWSCKACWPGKYAKVCTGRYRIPCAGSISSIAVTFVLKRGETACRVLQ